MNKHPIKITYGDEVNGLCMGIILKKSFYNIDERPILMEIFVSNISAKSIQIIESHILYEHDIELWNEDNRPVRMTTKGLKALEAARTLPLTRRKVIDIAPGKTHKVEPLVKLDEWFQLDEPGTYTVQVRRRYWQRDQGILTSGLATFVIA